MSKLLMIGLVFVVQTTMLIQPVLAAGDDKKVLYWVAPMDPNYRRDEPGKSPMGMELVPFYEGHNSGSGTSVLISPNVIQNLGIRSELVERSHLWRE